MEKETHPHQKGVTMATKKLNQRYTRALDELIQAQEYMDEVQEEYSKEAEKGFVSEAMATKMREARARLRAAEKEERRVKALSEAVQSEDDEAITRMKQEVTEGINRLMSLAPRPEEKQADSGAVAEQLTPTEDKDSSLIKILFLAANPADRDHLRLDAEMRDIDLALQQTAFRDRFDITGHGAVRAADLQGYLLRHKPDIVHFSSHGDPSSEIVLEDSSGKSHPVPVSALSTLFSVLKDNIRCVVLNACYSEQQAKAIAEHIDCVIGMSKAIGDTAATSFAIAFYQALGYGRSVQTAFDLGCAQIDLENLGEQDTPKLLALNNDPKTVVFVHNNSG